MSDPFPMPKTIGGSPYMPRRSETIEDAIASETARFEAAHVVDHAPPTTIDEIKALMRILLHREMRDLVKGIFEAHGKIQKPETTTRSPSITPTELADVLDKFAFGD